MIELTKSETQTLLLAIGTAVDKERHAIEILKAEVPARQIQDVIRQRSAHVAALDRLRERLTREN